jgi:hypothetical protein
MLPTIVLTYFVQKSLLVHNKIEKMKWSELPCLTVAFIWHVCEVESNCKYDDKKYVRE